MMNMTLENNNVKLLLIVIGLSGVVIGLAIPIILLSQLDNGYALKHFGKKSVEVPMDCSIQDDYKKMEQFANEHDTSNWSSGIEYYFVNGTKIQHPQRTCSYFTDQWSFIP